VRRVCVFAGAGSGWPRHRALARRLGEELGRRRLGLVYGGACVGIMGEVADAALGSGAEVIGVVPEGLWPCEDNHTGLAELLPVSGLYERKALMAELADAFVALPGGLGTLDELFDVLSRSQLGLHAKPVALLDSDGYFEPLLALLERAQRVGLLTTAPAALLRHEDDPARLLDALFPRPALGLACAR
jgi:uncharacterized protein (TIGR00730 family)